MIENHAGVSLALRTLLLNPMKNFPPFWTTVTFLLGGFCLTLAAENPTPETVRAVEADWAFQEKQKGRSIGDPEAVAELQVRLARLCADLGVPVPTLPEAKGERHYLNMRWQLREIALDNPMLRDVPIAFLKRNRFVCQMLHEYLGYYYVYPGITGGGIYVLKNPGKSFEIRSLSDNVFPDGVFQTLALSYDAEQLHVAFVNVDLSADQPRNVVWPQLDEHRFHEKTFEYLESKENKFQVYSVAVDGSKVEKLTDDRFDNFDPVPLPDGGIAFLSTRRGGFIRCNNIWEPLTVYTLHRMDADGANLRTLSFHETNEWHPAILNDGRLVYSRWDYVDRSAAHYHGLWTCLPDGTLPSVLFGNYTQMVSACYQPKAVPGSSKIVFVAGAHHAVTGGSLVLLDPMRTAYHPETAEDVLDSLERLTPEVEFPETPNQWPTTYYHSPWPLSENYYLTAYSREPLGSFGAGSDKTGRTGLYYFDRFGNLELLYEDVGFSCQYPLPLIPRERPPVIPDRRDASLGETGEFYLSNVYKSLIEMPEGRRIRELRIFQLLPKHPDWVANSPRLGYANAEGARMLLGTVPVDEKGTAYFTAPANEPLYFQAVDESGKAVQTMRSDVYLQSGERRSCVGCHEPLHSSPQNVLIRDKPDTIVAGPDGSKPLSFARLVQPILDRRCLDCHSGQSGAKQGKTDLRDKAQGQFSVSYNSLRPYVRWFEWGGDSISQTTTPPGHCGADESPLTKILDDENHQTTGLTDKEKRRIYLWLDANAPFHGVFER